MRITDYLTLIGSRFTVAEDALDRQECVRLGQLLREVATEYIEKVEKEINEHPRTETPQDRN